MMLESCLVVDWFPGPQRFNIVNGVVEAEGVPKESAAGQEDKDAAGNSLRSSGLDDFLCDYVLSVFCLCRERCPRFLAYSNEEQWSISWGGLCFLLVLKNFLNSKFCHRLSYLLVALFQITERDEGALKYLKDIKWCRIDNPKGFKLEFYFETNPFFKNSVLTKTYHMIDEDEPILEKAIG